MLDRQCVALGSELRAFVAAGGPFAGQCGPLLGQRSRLALRHEVPGQAHPPRAEDDHDGGDDHQGPTERTQGRRAGMTQNQHNDTSGRQECPRSRPQDELPPSVAVAVAPDAEHGSEVVVDPYAFVLTGVAPDENRETDGGEHRPADDADESDVEEGDEDLRGDDDGDDRDDQADAAPVIDGPGEDVGRLVVKGNDEPGQGVDQHRKAGEKSQQDEADPEDRGVDTGGLGHAAAHAGQDT